MKTLQDFLDENMNVMSVGLNPSPNSVLAGYPYATAQNRFWRALNASNLTRDKYEPSVAAMWNLLAREHIGFTDLVKRPTAGAADLRAADYKHWAPLLIEKIERYQPRVVWFQGKLTFSYCLRYGLSRKATQIQWGLQERFVAGIDAFVTPNPSAANAVFSLADITAAFDRLASFIARVGG